MAGTEEVIGSEAPSLAEAFAASPVPSCVVDMDGPGGCSVIAASDSLGALLDRPAPALSGLRLDAILAPAPGRPALRAAPDFDRAQGSVWVVEVRDGARVTVELQIARVGASTRNLRVVQLVDVTARETAQRSLRDAVARLQDIIDNCAALVFVKDLDGRYMLVNRYFEQRFGLLVADILGRTDEDLFPPEAAADYRAHDRDVLETAQPLEVEERAGEVGRTWLSIKFPLLDDRGRPYALGGISTDITGRLQMEAAAREARDEAERASRAKSEFLSRMSHELRTPLNAILGFGQLLELDDLPGGSAESVDGILAAGHHLLALINEVLDMSRIEAGALSVSPTPIPVCEPLQEALELIRPLALERDIELAADLHGGLFTHVLADPQGLRQALLNLLGNAVKYTPGGGAVRVVVRPRKAGFVRILIVDTGPGLTEDEQRQIFVPFERLSATSAQTPGTGLGLSVARSLVEAMNGRLGVQHSAPGDGSAFYVDLQAAAAPEVTANVGGEPAATPDDAPLGHVRVLYIEDNPSNLSVVRRILERAGDVEVTAAERGELGIELAARARPDLVLLDLNLPDVDGVAVLRALGEDPDTSAIPVIVLSADATPGRKRELIDEGAYAYITKPLDIPSFLGTVRRSLKVAS
ncbi:MAG TPA: ATP-binding protein [Solirubrobacteraceae bacterium]|nr:ATP-binding protein [Solirubrobacteraceae bacterium]